MKNINTIIKSVLVLTLLIAITTVAAAERVNVFELAESGIFISFQMTAEDTEIAIFNPTRKPNVPNPEERLHIFEMAESGQMISFPMSAEEIVAEDAAKVKSNASAIKVNKPNKRVIQFELAESGEFIEFPAHEVEVVTEYTSDVIGKTDKAELKGSKN